MDIKWISRVFLTKPNPTPLISIIPPTSHYPTHFSISMKHEGHTDITDFITRYRINPCFVRVLKNEKRNIVARKLLINHSVRARPRILGALVARLVIV